MSELKYSKGGSPVIHLIDAAGKTYGDFIFSRVTAKKDGYKYICFSHRYIDQVATKTGKGDKARTKFFEIAISDSYVFNMELKRDEAGKKGVPTGMMPRRLADWIKAVLSEFTMDGLFPFADIKELEPIIAELDIDAILVTEAELVRAAKKKARQQKKQDKIAAADQADADEKVMRDCIQTGLRPGIQAEIKKSVNLSDIF
jgi:hypothetical protein